MSQLAELTAKLKEIFQINRADLDFGIYRILNTRSQEIEHYLSQTLPQAVKTALGANQSEQITLWQTELAALQKTLEDAGVPLESSKKYQELQHKIEQAKKGSADHETAVYRHLLTFFSRYYDEGDFISQRRYKGDTYAVPYAGEEVLLHWANKDQYYTKSGENFSNYRFTLDDGRTVLFRLNHADIAKDNRKDNDAKRLFTLATAQTIERENDEGEIETLEIHPVSQSADGQTLTVLFDYKPFEKSAKQEKALEQDLKALLAHELLQTAWSALADRSPTEKNPNRTVLEKHLSDYTQKNTADYFIHKDLGGFLNRELDFYIKNEVMNLDEVQSAEQFSSIEANLRLIQTLRRIAREIIGFLAQLENFQKKLWLKKKFVAGCHYLITLDQVPSEFHAEIFANGKQREQWKNLFAVKDLPPSDLILPDNSNPYAYLVVDTSLFPAEFQSQLLTALSAQFSDSLDAHINGTLIHSDNFQALNLLQARYREQVKCIYIDPPYNTSASEIIYKNGYKHSSWLSLIADRIKIARNLLSETGIFSFAIDDVELNKAKIMISEIYGEQNSLGNIVLIQNPGGRHDDKFIATTHEYCLFFAKNIEKANMGLLPLEDEDIKSFNKEDQFGKYRTREFRRSGNNSTRELRPKMYFPIFLKNGNIITPTNDELEKIYKNGKFDDNFIDELINIYQSNGFISILPIDPKGIKRVWRWGAETIKNKIDDLEIYMDKSDILQIRVKDRLDNKEGLKPKTLWNKPKYAGANGTVLLKDIVNNSLFSYPKSLDTVIDNLIITSNNNSLILDYFAGSGTTAHAVINLNREDNGNRQYILVEQGEYFDTVLKPRVQKVIYSENWKDGKPVPSEKPSDGLNGVSQIVKVLKLESYEDTLNNLQLQRSDLLDSLPEQARHDYLLHYMLDIESRDSLLNVSHFAKPFDYGLNISSDSAGAYDWQKVDLVETFNYLIGAKVISVDDKRSEQGFVAVECRLPNQSADEKTLIFWRDCERVGYDGLQKQFDRLGINPADSEYSQVYVNGDHTLETVWDGEQSGSLKIISIEDAFLSLMFEGEA